ncbi:tumor necrosis factor ligand superfamily member 14 [Pelobates fuscus]|uniref:tumor necrosis factor ligand superfamily member 14 n=1 Tax=Pelobates fuscus TaxID=191477 RepID=UPI002FE4B249
MDRVAQPPVSVFTIGEYVDYSATVPLPVKKKWNLRGNQIFKWVLLILALIAICGAAAEIFILRTIQNKLEDTHEMVEMKLDAQIMNKEPGKPQVVPSAHITGTEDLTSESLLHWEPSQGLSFHYQVGYKNGSLLCIKSGHYYVYSKLQLGSRECSTITDTSAFYSHYVSKKSSNSEHEEVLLENSRRFCEIHGKASWKGSSYLAGIFFLNQGEEIYVKMSPKHLLRVKDGTTTFFGIFML